MGDATTNTEGTSTSSSGSLTPIATEAGTPLNTNSTQGTRIQPEEASTSSDQPNITTGEVVQAESVTSDSSMATASLTTAEESTVAPFSTTLVPLGSTLSPTSLPSTTKPKPIECE